MLFFGIIAGTYHAFSGKKQENHKNCRSNRVSLGHLLDDTHVDTYFLLEPPSQNASSSKIRLAGY